MDKATEATKRPSWIRVRRLDGATRELMQRSLGNLATVCVTANCPNIGECWHRGTATFMIMGDTCTRGCKFCATAKGEPGALDLAEPAALVDAVREMKLKYAVITCVTRDDLPDSGAAHWAVCVSALREQCPGVGTEVLVGDFKGVRTDVATVVRARPDVFAHNVEVIPRLQREVRPQASWETSMATLKYAREVASGEGIPLVIKSGLMLGLGETKSEVEDALLLLREAGVQLLTMGQYLKPLNVPGLLEVKRYVHPDEFSELADYSRTIGFSGVAASPLTRSSHLAETLYAQMLPSPGDS